MGNHKTFPLIPSFFKFNPQLNGNTNTETRPPYLCGIKFLDIWAGARHFGRNDCIRPLSWNQGVSVCNSKVHIDGVFLSFFLVFFYRRFGIMIRNRTCIQMENTLILISISLSFYPVNFLWKRKAHLFFKSFSVVGR